MQFDWISRKQSALPVRIPWAPLTQNVPAVSPSVNYLITPTYLLMRDMPLGNTHQTSVSFSVSSACLTRNAIMLSFGFLMARWIANRLGSSRLDSGRVSEGALWPQNGLGNLPKYCRDFSPPLPGRGKSWSLSALAIESQLNDKILRGIQTRIQITNRILIRSNA